MNDFVSLRLLASLLGLTIDELVAKMADGGFGIATTEDGKIDDGALPASAVGAYLGSYANLTAAQTAHPTGQTGQYFYNQETGTVWYWNSAMTPPAWTNKEITITDYNALTDEQKAQQPWLIIPDAAA